MLREKTKIKIKDKKIDQMIAVKVDGTSAP